MFPFREAHGRVGKLVKHLSSSEKVQHGQFSNLSAETLEKFLEVKITPKEISAIMNPQSVLDRRKAIGAPNPKLVSQTLSKRLGRISKHEDTLHSFEVRMGKLRGARVSNWHHSKTRKNGKTFSEVKKYNNGSKVFRM